jgi:WD40 repeat protein
MAWPVSQDYNEAVQSPSLSFTDPDLRAGEAVTNALGIPRPRSGNFADVYQMRCNSGDWAAKCFTREVRGLQQRYAAVSAHLHQAKLPFAVEFEFLEQGIRVHDSWFPLLKMRWVEGLTLNEFVRDNLDKPVLLQALLQIWQRMAKRLREADIAHGDLQHGNILLVPGKTEQSLAVRLIDYDGMWVPALAQARSGEVGHPNFQHPQRLREGTYGPEVDQFPLLVVAAALRCLQVGGRPLWDRYDNGDNLLFKESDFAAPHESPLFAELLQQQDTEARRVAAQLMAAAQKPLDNTPLLDDVFSDRPTAAPPPVLAVSAPTSYSAAAAFPTAEEVPPPQMAPRRRARRPRPRKKSPLPLLLGVLFTLVIVGGGVAGWLMLRGPTPTSRGTDDNRFAFNQGPQTSVKVPFRTTGAIDTRPAGTTQRAAATTPSTARRPPPTSQRGPIDPAPHEPRPVEVVRRPPGAPGAVRVIDPAVGSIWAVAFSPDGRRVIAGGEGGISAWSPDDGKEVLPRPEAHEGRVTSVAFSSDGTRALSGSAGKTFRLWEVGSGRTLTNFADTGEIDSVAFVPQSQRVASIGRSSPVRLWDARTGMVVDQLGAEPTTAYALAISPDGRQALFERPGHVLSLWDIPGKREVRALKGHTWHVYALAFAPNGKVAASGGGDNTIRLWDLEKGEEVGRIDQHIKPVQGLVFTHDGRLVSCSDDQTVRVWDAVTLEELCRFEGHTNAVRSVALSPDEAWVVSGSIDKSLRLWRLPAVDVVRVQPDKPDLPVYTLEKHIGQVRRAAISADGRQALTAGLDGSLRLWDLARGEQIKELRPPDRDEGQYMCAFLPGERALGGTVDKSLRLWDLREGKPINTWPGHAGEVYHLACSLDGKWAISCGAEKMARLWDVAEGKVVRQLDVGEKGATNVAFSADGSRAAAYCIDGFLRVWNVATCEEVRRIDKGPHAGEGIALSPDGRLIAAARQKAVGVWETDTGKELLKLEGNTYDVFAVAFTPDGRRVVSGGIDCSVRVWDLATAKEVTHFAAHKNWVTDVACTPDGRYVLSSSRDGTVKLWHLPTAPLMFGSPLKLTAPPLPVVTKPDDRTPVPALDALAEAEKLVKEAHKEDYTKRKKEEIVALATKMSKEGLETKDKSALRYVLLREARDLAARAGDLGQALDTARAMADNFQVVAEEMKAEALDAAQRPLPGTIRVNMAPVAATALAVADEATEADEHALAVRLVNVATKLSTTWVNHPVAAAAQARHKEAEALRKAYEELRPSLEKLKANPSDPEAALAVGRFYALVKGDWDRGLELLARGNDVKLKALAEVDLASPADGKAAAELAARYVDHARTAGDADKIGLLFRAHYWYERARARLSGPDQTRVEMEMLALERLLPWSRPVVVQALYGAFNGWLDATHPLRVLLVQAKGQRLSFEVHAHTLSMPRDPAFGENKTLAVTLRYRGGTRLYITADGATATIPFLPGPSDSGPARPAAGQELVILAALLGNHGTFADATDRVQPLVTGRTASVDPRSLGVPDPTPNRHKALLIAYREAGKVRLTVVAENAAIQLGGP